MNEGTCLGAEILVGASKARKPIQRRYFCIVFNPGRNEDCSNHRCTNALRIMLKSNQSAASNWDARQDRDGTIAHRCRPGARIPFNARNLLLIRAEKLCKRIRSCKSPSNCHPLCLPDHCQWGVGPLQNRMLHSPTLT
eukprot:CAMPEP_0169391464 /NCGR_PEP_ID=MMETSP1017-20121227/48065_1 /TAXON_ID=342587 /ORGANISM="Karlodinium micrum, Strain CCMP2283" /LENGTH=137 /DNA_ID=CAMNT_0009494271 /DNA_START=54 /DNA_END=463 /DNA_ORIENTATION=+